MILYMGGTDAPFKRLQRQKNALWDKKNLFFKKTKKFSTLW